MGRGASTASSVLRGIRVRGRVAVRVGAEVGACKAVALVTTILILSVIIAVFALVGRATVITPPPLSSPPPPHAWKSSPPSRPSLPSSPIESDRARARVALVDYGHHPSLVIERSDGALIEYAYGDWEYFALGKDGVDEALAALFWPSQAGLGRKLFSGPVTVENIRRQLAARPQEVLVFDVEAARAESLVRRLERLFFAHISSRVYNPSFELEFVHHPDAYWAFHNSNQVTAKWLKALGCRLDGYALFSNWELEREPAFQ
jgi:hypothetical protein